MSDVQVLEIFANGMLVASKLAGPLLIVVLVVGVGVSLFQTVTQIQEQTLSFVPKVLGMAAVLLVSGNWMLREVVNFASSLWSSIPSLVGAG
ncbi:flagellar biosynthetic protein FliQ [Egicoccus halophilus]|uniref:Flagellar biosynthetic protein FliQ n=1 Tax=Egicoccus halophilus TaxID=1670830 RepID=A0A8J3AE73_9ACTN|nr:flagellar biosynthetic protein FliQ [Egicoccus halophilus]GGI06725.1 flagellar biosynthetic protein FliQ [Egicoccus halophilus]